MSEKHDEKIQKLQLFEQNAQQLLAQRQQFQTQLIEIDSALAEIDKTKESYKIIGNIMVSTSKEDLKKELKEKKTMVDIRVKSIEKQEKEVKDKAKKRQEEVLKGLEQKK